MTSLSATQGSLSTSVTSQQAALVTATGQLYASAGLIVSAGNVITGVKYFSASGATNVSAIVFSADNFIVRASNGATLSFTLDDGGTLTATNLRVKTLNIDGQAVTSDTLAYGAALRTAFAERGAWAGSADLVNVGVVSIGGVVQVSVTVQGLFTAQNTDAPTFYMRVYRNGALIKSLPVIGQPCQDAEVQTTRNNGSPGTDTVRIIGVTTGPWTFTFPDAPGAGSFNYDLGVDLSGTAGGLAGSYASISVGASR